jgi:hypothetical protein
MLSSSSTRSLPERPKSFRGRASGTIRPSTVHPFMSNRLQITSLGGRDLVQRGWPRSVRVQYLPIHPAPPHPDTTKLLFLEGGHSPPKRSYVNTKTVRTMPVACLRPFLSNGHELIVTFECFREVLEMAKYEPPLILASSPLASSPLAITHHPATNTLGSTVEPTAHTMLLSRAVSLSTAQSHLHMPRFAVRGSSGTYSSKMRTYPATPVSSQRIQGVHGARYGLLDDSVNREDTNRAGSCAQYLLVLVLGIICVVLMTLSLHVSTLEAGLGQTIATTDC